jgi:LmbE family N-acetylglucosaminyl deacetylase
VKETETKKTIGFVGAHMDDIELGCGGTIQALKKRGYETVGLVISTDPKRQRAGEETAKLLGYKLVLGGISEDEIEIKKVQKIIHEKLIQPFAPFAVFGHSPKDDHHHHIAVSIGTDSACRRVKNLLHYCGPLRKWEFAPNVFFTFFEEEHKKKIQALEILGAAYGKTRYFTEQYSMESAWLGQRIYEYEQRELAPYIEVNGKKVIPYAEGFEARRLRDPF